MSTHEWTNLSSEKKKTIYDFYEKRYNLSKKIRLGQKEHKDKKINRTILESQINKKYKTLWVYYEENKTKARFIIYKNH